MTALRFVLTNAGRAAMVDAEAGGTSAIVIAEAGVTASVVVAAPTLTALPGEIKRVDTLSGIATDDHTVHLTVRDGSADAYTCRAIGLYLADGTLFAVYAQPLPICEKVAVTSFYIAADLVFVDGNANLIQFGDANFLNPIATEDVPGIVYLATIAEALAGAVADKVITPIAMKAVLDNYVAASKLGVANGVATLGPDGKLLVSQRPPIDLIDVFAVVNQAAMLALAATPGDFAVRADNGLIYVLQVAPATTLANWLEISTPAPVSSVNGKVGTVVLDAADVGAAPATRSITGAGLVTGGGNLSADRALTVAIASAAEALAGVLNNKAVTPASLATILTMLNAATPGSRTITGGGLATGGGDLTANRIITVDAASPSDVAAGTSSTKAVTPAALAGLASSLMPDGYVTLPGGLIIQWVRYRASMTAETVVNINFPIAFPNAALIGVATGWITVSTIYRDMWAQLVGDYSQYGALVQAQGSTNSTERRLDGFDVIFLGY